MSERSDQQSRFTLWNAPQNARCAALQVLAATTPTTDAGTGPETERLIEERARPYTTTVSEETLRKIR